MDLGSGLVASFLLAALTLTAVGWLLLLFTREPPPTSKKERPETDLTDARKELLAKLRNHHPSDGLSEALSRTTDRYLQLKPTDTEVRKARDDALPYSTRAGPQVARRVI